MRMHDHRVACSATCPHDTSFLHPPLHPSGGATPHPPRTHSTRHPTWTPALFLARAFVFLRSTRKAITTAPTLSTARIVKIALT